MSTENTTPAPPRRRMELKPDEIAASVRLREAFTSFEQRTGRSLSQYQAASMLGMSQPAVNQYLKGSVALNVKSTLRFAELLKVDPASIYPELEAYFSLAKHSSKVKVEATFTKDGRLVKPNFEKELDWTAPVPNARVIVMEKDLGPSCPQGTMLVYDADKVANAYEVLANPHIWYVVDNIRGKRFKIYPCKVSVLDKMMRFIEDGSDVLDLSTANEFGKLPNGVTIHPVIGKMCLTGLI